MGLFSKFKKKTKEENNDAVVVEKDLLVDVQETVTTAVISVMNENTNFKLTTADGVYNVSMYLDCSQFLNRPNDDTEGFNNFINLLNNSRIVAINNDSLDKNILIIIPTNEAINNYMDEYSIFRSENTKYRLAFFKEGESDFRVSDAVVDFNFFKFIASGDKLLVKSLKELDSDDFIRGLLESKDVTDESVNTESVQEEESEQSIPEAQDDSEQVESQTDAEFDAEDDTEEVYDENFQEFYDDEIQELDSDEPFDDSYHEDIVEDLDEVIDEDFDNIEKVSENILAPGSITYNPDISLFNEIEEDYRDNAIVIDMPNIGGDWLDSYIYTLVSEANTELSNHRNKIIMELKNEFLDLSKDHISKILKLYDYENSDTDWSIFYQSIEEKKRINQSNLDTLLRDGLNKLEEEYNNKRQRYIDTFVATARAKYDEENLPRHEYNRGKLRSDLINEIEINYSNDKQNFYEKRKSSSDDFFRVGNNEIASYIRDKSLEYKFEEEAIYNKWKRIISDYRDANKDSNILAINTLKEELEQETKAEKLVKDYNIKIQTLNDEAALEKDKLINRIEEIKKENEEYLNLINEQHNSEMSFVKSELDVMTKKYDNINKAKDLEYKHKLEKLSDEKDSWENRYDDSVKVNKRNIVMLSILAVALIIASLVMGVLLGSNMNNSSDMYDKYLYDMMMERK